MVTTGGISSSGIIVMVHKYKFMAFLLYICICMLTSRVEGALKRPRGVALSKTSLYNPETDFSCLDGTIKVPFDKVNDDYCDCRDGSDEPGTAACPNGSFHCVNRGFKSLNLPSSRVNDGICDCCDGSDEYAGLILCKNSCREQGKNFREEQERLRTVMVEGHQIYQDYIKRGTWAVNENKARRDALDKEKVEAEYQKDDTDKAKKEHEEPEREAKEKYKQQWEEEKKKVNESQDKERMKQAFNFLDRNQDDHVSMDEMKQVPEFDIDSNGEVSDEEAREYLEDESFVTFEMFDRKVWPNIKEIYRAPHEPPRPKKEKPKGEEEKKEKKSDDEWGEDGDPENWPTPSEGENQEVAQEPDEWKSDSDEGEKKEEEKPTLPEDPNMPPYPEDVQKLISLAENARKAHKDAEENLKRVENELAEAHKLSDLDLGPNNEFYLLRGECFHYTDREYTYSMCPFDKCIQRPKHGGQETKLGNWARFGESDADPVDKKYKVMMFDNGQGCWNGPDRSVKVSMTCGVKNELTSASEPSRCEYEFTFTTPAVCNTIPEPVEAGPDEEEQQHKAMHEEL